MPEPGGAAEQEGQASGLVFVLSGPSGVGKDSVTGRLKEQGFPLSFCVTATTRRPRLLEQHGVHYYFLDNAEYDRMLAEGEFLESAAVHGNRYGIPRFEVRKGLRRGLDLMITVDVQGGETLRTRLPGAIFIFLAPESLDDLPPRLMTRGTESEAERTLRLENAKIEMQQWPRYDYFVVNQQNRLAEAVEKIKAIVIAERQRVKRRLVTL
ncbi:MAG: guanylate kinase [Chloroflexi bacterium]|nr:guanylate kinase [Chloroflexota bacterium]